MSSESKSGFFSAIKSVLAAFFGVQSDHARKQDFSSGKPQHFIIAGILVTIIFIVLILILVKIVMRDIAV